MAEKGRSSKTHKAAMVVRNNHDFHFEVQDLSLPEPAPSEVLVKLSVTGVCGTDFALASGEAGPTCKVLGHEGIGRVVKLGSGVSPSEVAFGQRVGVAWQRDVCGRCAACLIDGGETRCEQQLQSGRKIEGTFAEYTLVPMRYILRIPEGLPDAQLAPILCGGVTIYKALKICGANAGQWVLISGAGGGVGALGIQYGKAMGFRIIAVDVGDHKQKHCLESGAEVYLNAADKDFSDRVMKTTSGNGVNAVLVTAGSERAYQQSFGIMAPFATLVCIGIPPPEGTVTFHPLMFIDKGYKIIGSAVGTRGDILEAIEFVRRGAVTPLVMEIGLSSLADITHDFKEGKVIGKYIIRYTNDDAKTSS